MERTLILIKPDAIGRGLIGRIVTRFEEKGLKLVGIKFLKLSSLQRNALERLLAYSGAMAHAA